MSRESFSRLPAATKLIRVLGVLAVVVLCGFLSARSANAQYMYLDSNGDGVHTAADVISATGTTRADVYLRTNTMRDGSPAVCPAGDPLTINSYEFCLGVVGGTVLFSNATNLQGTMSTKFGDVGNSQQYYFGYGGAAALPAGTYLLARLDMATASGTPSIEIEPTAPLVAPFGRTSFGSRCVGNNFDNTLKLGSDWHDVDGLAYSSGGATNTPPVIASFPSMTAATGEVTAQDVSAADPDGDALAFALSGAPAFVTLTSLTNGLGVATARIHVSPLRGDIGTYTATVQASDHLNSSSASAAIDVSSGPDHVAAIVPVSSIDVVATTVARVPIEAFDTDGDPVDLQIPGAPPFLSLEMGARGSAARAGFLVLRPTLCDIGTFHVPLTAGFSAVSSTQDLSIAVHPPSAVSGDLVRTFPGAIEGIAAGDFNRDGHLDVAAATSGSPGAAGIVIYIGDGSGGLGALPKIPVEDHYTGLGVGDWTGDGNLDLIAGGYSASDLQFYRGRGDGSFDQAISLPNTPLGVDFRSGDFDHDGIQDLAVASESNEAYVVARDGTGGVKVAYRIPVGSRSMNVAVGDFDLDGRLDLAFTASQPTRVDVLFGRGDLTFGGVKSTPLPNYAVPLAGADFDHDGRLDLVTSLLDHGEIEVLHGDGHGGFSATQVGVGSTNSPNATTLDWNSDGNQDFCFSGGDGAGVVYPGNGNGTFGTPIPTGLAFGGQEVTVGDMNEDGRPDLIIPGWVALNGTQSVTGVAARAFPASPEKPIALNSSSSLTCIRAEPVGSTFQAADIDLSTIKLLSDGAGAVSSIDPSTKKASAISDTDKDGILDIGVCFATSDMSRLLSNLRGKQTVTAQLQGALVDGRRFCAPLALTVIGTGALPTVARVEPNPLNPEGTLRFTTRTAGAVSVRLFDVSGRLVRSLWNSRTTAAGNQEVRIDGKDAGGRTLRSGVYFYRIDGAGMNETGRFTILK